MSNWFLALFHDDDVNAESTEVTHMVTQWGQFLDHDIVLTPEEEAHDCCHDDSDQYCMQISVPSDDYFYGEHGITCLEFSRSVGFCEEDIAIDSAEHNQLNAITAYVDASNVYGSSEAERDTLRALDGTGKLAVDEYNLLPFLGADERKAGDVRAREMPGLATMHTLWVREHNRLCDALTNHKDVTSDWTDDDYFENEREILLDLNDVWCYHQSCGALKIGRYKYIRGNKADVLPSHYDFKQENIVD